MSSLTAYPRTACTRPGRTTREARRRGRALFGALLTLVLSLSAVTLGAAPASASDAYNSITSASAANTDWMSRVADGTSLSWLSVPGTHDSLALCGERDPRTGNCGGVATSITQTQENHGFSAKTLTTQFRAGIRALDIRVRLDKGDEGLKFTIHHGAAYQYANFTDVLNATRDFLRAEPGETVLLHLKAECDGGAFGCEDAEGFGTDEWRKKVFDSYLNGRSYTGKGDETTEATAWRDLFWAPSVTGSSQADRVPTLGEVRGKVVLMGYRATRGNIYDGYGIRQPYPAGGSNKEYVQDEYEVSTISDIAGKWEKVRAHLRRTNGTWDASRPGEKEYPYQPGALYINYTSGTGGGAHPYTVAGGTPTATGVNSFLRQCLRGDNGRCPEFHPGRGDKFGGRTGLDRLGVVMMDFPGGKLIDDIIGRNQTGGSTLRVMVVGDSMTQGHEGDYTWRYRLWQWFRDQRVPVDFVGPYTGTRPQDEPSAPQPPRLQGEPEPAPGPPRTSGDYARDAEDFDSDHFAVWGRQAAQDKTQIKEQVARYKPDLMLVGLGFNDMGWFVSDASGTLSSMKTLVDEARAVEPNLKFALANVPQRTKIDGRDDLIAKTTEYNRLLADAVPRWHTSTSPVALVDWRGAYDCAPAGCPAAYDGLHPNAVGEYQIAGAFGSTLHKEFHLGSSAPGFPTTAPPRPSGTPGNVRAVAADSGIVVTWDEVFGAYGYEVRSRPAGAPGWSTTRAFGNRLDSTWITEGQTWEYQVRADGGGTMSEWSGTVSATAHPKTAPGPVGIVTRPTPTGIDVAWGAPTGPYTDTIDRYGVITYDLDTPGAFIETIGTRDKALHFGNLKPGHRYAVAIQTWNKAGGGLPAAGRPVLVGAGTPSAPTGLKVVSTDPTTVQLNWTGSAQAAGYRVWIRNINDGSPSRAEETIAQGTNHGVAFLYPGVWNYEFCVTAVNGALESGKSHCVVAPRPAGS
ncbi:phosphatidylinositol-specific phospholipase C domain-containing protein [Streptomyces sp. LP05-1]|uniref:1-phosphatidylinositol phosphodiesterase n=1 Tax=Streptomyces pyxinae TaxID=2970734 RepID=A0ABT2CQG6_9ACTN|nr:phosphatidylinositol-specific phospholipase C domain-containing protein [Streptomyces sp. LP05-1]MCS0639663.1 phosphatidylinositol-specific phospholipase C domain-containing protein [Streptomyces sp. LP05-1]